MHKYSKNPWSGKTRPTIYVYSSGGNTFVILLLIIFMEKSTMWQQWCWVGLLSWRQTQHTMYTFRLGLARLGFNTYQLTLWWLIVLQNNGNDEGAKSVLWSINIFTWINLYRDISYLFVKRKHKLHLFNATSVLGVTDAKLDIIDKGI